ncbi:MAG: aldo/keto reductase [Planctomycetaceae bacterium]|nr:aldo/keto reductase [Planctomycetaceae bacterium]
MAKKASTKKKTTKKAAAKKTAPKKTVATKATPKKAASKAAASKAAAAAPAQPVAASVDFADQVECFSMKWGAQFPKVGLGFWKVEEEKTADVCTEAIRVGYRHLDCACDYGNEVQVGKGIANAVKRGYCDREDLWVTSKLWNTYHAANHVKMACEKSLEDLGLDYLDLYLIHFPIAQRFVPIEKRYPPGWFFEPKASEPVIEEASIPLMETWQAMEELAKSGMVRNIGICNVGTSQLRDLMTYAKIKPAVLQVESHPYLTQDKLLRYCNEQGITYTAFSPLGAESYFSLDMAKPSEAVLEHKTIKTIAKEVGRTPAQVLLRWGVQRGTSVIPKTSSPERLVENINVFDFQLTQKQMKAISALDQGRRFNDPGDFGEAAFNTFLPIYE